MNQYHKIATLSARNDNTKGLNDTKKCWLYRQSAGKNMNSYYGLSAKPT